MYKKMIMIGCPIFLIAFAIFSDLRAEAIYEDHLEINESSEDGTLSFQAKSIAHRAAKQDIDSLAKSAILTCYNAYKPNFDQLIGQDRGQLRARGMAKSSYYDQVPITYAKSFAEAIITQIDTLTKNLSAKEKQTFWSVSEQHIKEILDGFCKGHASSSTTGLHSHITNMINMKKTFG